MGGSLYLRQIAPRGFGRPRFAPRGPPVRGARRPGQRTLDAGGAAPVNAAVPKSGQRWDPGFLKRSALLADLRALGAPLLGGASWPSLERCSELVEAERRARASDLPPVRFAPPLPRKRALPIDIEQLYDGRIALRGEVPCLGTSYHDLLNVLVWAAFPRAKRALHARQYRALQAWLPPGSGRLPNRRTREQDALALFDEGGSVLVASAADAAALREALAAGAAPELALPGAARVVLFGHAVMEHLCFESAALSSAALVVELEPPLPEGRALLDRVDRALAARLADPRELASPVFDAVLALEPPDGAGLRAEPAPARAAG